MPRFDDAGLAVSSDSQGTRILMRIDSKVWVLDRNGKKQAEFPINGELASLAMGRVPNGSQVLGFREWGRAIHAYDAQGKHRWKYGTGETGIDAVTTLDIGDPQGDAIAIGYNGGGIELLDANGKQVWRADGTGNTWSVAGVRLAVGAPESVVAVGDDALLVYDAGGKLQQTIQPFDVGLAGGADLDGDGRDEIFGMGTTQVSGGFLWVFDADGKLLWKRKSSNNRVAHVPGSLTAGRFRGTKRQIAVGFHDRVLYLFDSDGTPLPGIRFKSDLLAITTLPLSNGQDGLLAMTATDLLCYAWDASKPIVNPVVIKQEAKSKPLLESAFVRAVQQNDVPAVRAMLLKGTDPNTLNSQGSPVLVMAAARGHVETARLLLDKGANLKARRKDGMNAFVVAIFEGHLPVVRLLIERGVNVNAFFDFDQTQRKMWDIKLSPLIAAVQREQSDIVEALLNAGAKVNLPDTFMGRTPLAWADKVEIARLLLDRGATVDSRDMTGQTPLMNAVLEGNVDIVKLLIERGANVNARESMIHRLHFMAQFGGDTATQKKIERSGKMKERHEDGVSVLQFADGQTDQSIRAEMIALLKKAGAH